jgi:predicted O-methyltransferase YrrM
MSTQPKQSKPRRFKTPAWMRISRGRIKRWGLDQLLPSPCAAEEQQYSMLYSAHDEPGRPTDTLIALSLQISQRAAELKRRGFAGKMKTAPARFHTWPGEHYYFLAALADVLRPRLFVEIGTHLGYSALSILETLPSGSELVTYDIIPWQEYAEARVDARDFRPGRFSQRIGDLANADYWEANRDVFQRADVVFVDGPKDGRWEDRFIARLERTNWFRPQLVVFDDVRLWGMLKTWRRIARPKLDLASFGHFTGTGLVEWNPPAKAI